MNFVIGATGRLGRTIFQFLAPNETIGLERQSYAEWWRPKAADQVAFFLEQATKNNNSSRIYVAAGILDPNRPEEEHHNANFLLAKNIIEGANKVGIQTITFGTVMEKILGFSTTNPYIQSKTRLSHFVADCSSLENPPLHIRLHTLYGIGLPSPFMFLGQILTSLVNNTIFEMSPGNQLREYHHVEDEVQAIISLVDAQKKGIVELNHGKALSLKAIAHYLFEKFDCLNLLKIGASTAPQQENYKLVFEATSGLTSLEFRDPLPSIESYLRLCLKRQEHICPV